MDPTPSLWEGILRRASALRRRYANLAEAPQDTWSLVNRVAAEKFAGQLAPDARDRGHVYGLWTRAMVSVLNDLHRRARPPASAALEHVAGGEEPRDEDLRVLAEVLDELARQDAAMGERKALLVALRYVEGLTWEELASALGSSVRRTRDEWDVTRAWLRRELERRGVGREGA
jgi:DNA-directed RNA polymerase specialized sigma24 family protein